MFLLRIQPPLKPGFDLRYLLAKTCCWRYFAAILADTIPSYVYKSQFAAMSPTLALELIRGYVVG